LKLLIDKVKTEEQEGNLSINLERFEQYVDNALDTKNNMTGFFTAFMDIAKAEQMSYVDIGSMIESAARAMFDEANRSKVEINLNISPQHYNIKIRTIPVMLKQVFINILLNAVQHMRASKREKGRVTVSIKHLPDNNLPVKVRFSDTGPGIHSDIYDLIFEPMFSTKGMESGYGEEGGNGMGLAICRSLLAEMGGKISLEETAILTGTTFLVELPMGVG
jgi:signal transduction histidine kinase